MLCISLLAILETFGETHKHLTTLWSVAPWQVDLWKTMCLLKSRSSAVLMQCWNRDTCRKGPFQSHHLMDPSISRLIPFETQKILFYRILPWFVQWRISKQKLWISRLRRLISLNGVKGIGKSALLAVLGHFIHLRCTGSRAFDQVTLVLFYLPWFVHVFPNADL